MLEILASRASLHPYSRNGLQQSIPRTEPLGPTRLASSMAVSPNPHPMSTTWSPSLTLREAKIFALWRDNPPTMMCLYFENFGTRMVFQKSTDRLLLASVTLMGSPCGSPLPMIASEDLPVNSLHRLDQALCQ